MKLLVVSSLLTSHFTISRFGPNEGKVVVQAGRVLVYCLLIALGKEHQLEGVHVAITVSDLCGFNGAAGLIGVEV